MLGELIKRLEAHRPGTVAPTSATRPLDRHDLERVSALLLIEVARADLVIDPDEIAAVRAAVARASTLPPGEIAALVDEAAAAADATVSLHAHVQTINDALDKDEKITLLEAMWRVALADGDLDRYEEHRIRKLSDLMYLKHRDFVQAKLRVIHDPAADA